MSYLNASYEILDKKTAARCWTAASEGCPINYNIIGVEGVPDARDGIATSAAIEPGNPRMTSADVKSRAIQPHGVLYDFWRKTMAFVYAG